MKILADYVRILRPINIIISAGTVIACADILKSFENIPLLIYTILTVSLFIGGANIFNDIQDKNEEWNRVNPPLQKILNPSSHKTIIGLIQLLKKMDELIPPS